MADAQKVSPSTVYNVQGSPDDYNYILKGADLILVNKQTNEEQVFLFVGNIMSLDGQVNMEFSNGQSLDSPNLFQRSEMPDMDKQDEEAPEWEAVTDDSTPSDDEEGNSDEGNLGEGELLNAQAALVTDPTDDILKTQQRMFDDINKFAQQESLSSTPDPIDPIQGQDIDQPDPKDDPEKPEKEIIGGGTNPPIPTPTPNNSKVTIALSQESESGIKTTDSDTGETKFVEDGITKNTDLKIEGTADPNTKLNIFMDGSKIGEATADADGNYNITLTGAAEGDHEFYAQIADGTGESAAKSSKLEVEVDTTAPTLNDDAKADSTSKVTFPEDNGNTYTNQNRPLIEGTGESDTILTITYTSTDGSVTGTLKDITVNSSGNWSYRFPEGSELPEGTYTFTIAGQDDAGNALAATQQIQNVVVKTSFTTGATISLDTISDSMGTHADAAANDQITNETDLKLTITNIHEDARQVTVYLANADGTKTELGTASLNADKSAWTYTVDNSRIPADGTYTFMVEAMDMAGNVYQPASSLPVVIDRTAPTEGLDINLDADSDSQDHRGEIGNRADHYTHGTEATDPEGAGRLKISGSGAGTAGRVNLYLINSDGSKTLVNTDDYIQANADGTWTYTYDASSNGTSGAETLNFRAEITDEAGNIESADLTVQVDNTDPTQSSIEVEGALETTTTAHGLSTSVTGSTVTLKGLIEESPDKVIVTLYKCNADGSNASEVTHSKAAGTGLSIVADGENYEWSYDISGVVHDHNYSYYVTVEDAAGNISTSKVMTFTSDQQTNTPSIELDASTDTAAVGDDITDFVTSGGTESHDIKLKVTADDDATLKVYVVVDSSDADAVDLGNGNFGKLISSGKVVNGDVVTYDASAYDNQETQLQFITVATDEAGNTNTSPVYTMVLDDKAPENADIVIKNAETAEVYADEAASNAKALTLSGDFNDGITTSVSVTAPVVRVYEVDSSGTKNELGTATVNGDASTGYSWSFNLGNAANPDKYISEGKHSFKIEVEDAAGNITTEPAGDETIDINIDRTPPVISASLADDAGGDSMDTGRSETDWITNLDDNLKIDVDINEAGTITLVVNGQQVVSREVTADELNAGKAVLDLSSLNIEGGKLTEGADNPNSVKITVTDIAGNSSEIDETLVIDQTIDTGSIEFKSGSDTGELGDNITTITNPSLKGKTEPNAKVEVRIIKVDSNGTPVLDGDGNQIVVYTAAAMMAGANGDWEITPDALASGTYSVTAQITDIAGNTDVTSMPLTIAAKPESPSIAMDEDSAPLLFSTPNGAEDGVTFDTEPKFIITKGTGTSVTMTYWQLDENGHKIESSKQTVTYDSDADKAMASVDTGDLTLADGKEYTFEFVVQDAAGNPSDTVTKNVSIDASYDAADLTVAYSPEGGATVVTDADGINLTKDSNPDISGTAEKGSQVRMMVLSYDSKAAFDADSANDPTGLDTAALRTYINTGSNKSLLESGLVSVDAAGNWTAEPSFGTAQEDKYYRVVIVSEDQAGNLEAKTVEFHHDNTPPDAPEIWMTDDGDTQIISGDALNNVRDLSPRFEGTYDDEAYGTTTITIECPENGYSKVIDVKDITANDGTWSYQFGESNGFLKKGTYTATISSKDAAGNESKDSFEFTVKQDTIAPQIELFEDDITGETDTGHTYAYTSLQKIAADDTNNQDATPDQAHKLTLTGSAMATYTVEVFEVTLNDKGEIVTRTSLGTTTAKEDGTWELPFTSNPDAGDYHYIVTCDGEDSSVYTLHIDNTIELPEISLGNDTGTIENAGTDWITNDPTITGDVEAKATVKIEAARTYTATLDSGTGKYTYTDKHDVSHTVNADSVIPANGKMYFVDSSDVTEYNIPRDDTSGGTYSTTILTDSSGKKMDGQYQLTVTTTDRAGNTSSSTSNNILEVDSSTITPTLHMDSDSDSFFADGTIVDGIDVYANLPQTYKDKLDSFKTDEITKDNTPTIVGTAEPGAQVSIKLTFDSHTTVYTEQVDENGNWSFTPKSALVDGDYSVEVIAADAAGNTAISETPLTFTVDSRLSRVPDISVTGDDDGHGVSGNLDIFYTGQENANLHLVGEAGAAYVLYRANPDGSYTAVDSDFLSSNGAADYAINPGDYPANALDDGEHDLNFKLVTVDAAGNVQSSDFTVKVDIAPPAPATSIDYTSLTGDETATIDASNNVSIHTNDNKTDLIVNTAEDTAIVQLWEKVFKADGSYTLTFVTSAQVSSGSATLDLTQLNNNILEEGTKTYSIKFIDDVGNHAPASDVTLTMEVDTNPTAVDIALDNDSDRGFDATDTITSGETFQFNGNFSEVGVSDYSDIGYKITISGPNGPWEYMHTAGTASSEDTGDTNYIQNINVNDDGSYSFNFHDPHYGDTTHGLDNGEYTVSITATDEAGNNSDTASSKFTLSNNTLDDLNLTTHDLGTVLTYEDSGYVSSSESDNYKVEYTAYDKDHNVTADGEGTLSKGNIGSSYFKNDGDAYLEVKAIDQAGNESKSEYIDLDRSDLNFTTELDSGKNVSDIESIKATVFYDADKDGVLDDGESSVTKTITKGTDGTWSMDFGNLANGVNTGNYVLRYDALDSDGNSITSNDNNGFTFTIDDMTTTNLNDDLFNSDDQDFNGANEGKGGEGDTTQTNPHVVEAEIHNSNDQHHIDFDIA